MATKIDNLPDFIEAVYTEFDINYKGLSEDMRKLLLGERISSIKDGSLKESEYIQLWLKS